MAYFVVFDAATGNVRWRAEGDPTIQRLPDELKLLVIPQEAVLESEINLAMVKSSVLARINDEAESTRQQFITPGSGQMGTYLNKKAEATAYFADNTAPTPYLTAEAAATGTTVPALAALVQAASANWLAIDIKIEAARCGAKEAVKVATEVEDVLVASQVDWNSVIET